MRAVRLVSSFMPQSCRLFVRRRPELDMVSRRPRCYSRQRSNLLTSFKLFSLECDYNDYSGPGRGKLKADDRPAGVSRREEYAEATRQAILQAARRLFSERGYFSTKVDEIASLA